MKVEWHSINTDLAKGIIPLLNKMINRTTCWPGDDGYLKTYEDWLDTLRQMRDGFQAFVDIQEMNYGLSDEQQAQYKHYTRGFKFDETGEKEYVTEKMEFGSAATSDPPRKDEVEYWTFESVWEGEGPEPTMDDKRRGLDGPDGLIAKKNRGLELFAEYFDSLWD